MWYEILLLFLGWVAGIGTVIFLAYRYGQTNPLESKYLEQAMQTIKENGQALEARPLFTPNEDHLPDDMWISRIRRVRSMAEKHQWTEITFDRSVKMISFTRLGTRLNFYYSTMTVGTALKHPKQGPTQMFRRNIEWEELEKIFINPRVHTDKGYQRT